MIALASGAGRLLNRLRSDPHSGASAVDLRAAGDRTSQEWLAAELKHRHPDDAVLSEEAPDDLARLDANRVWIIDPLDGTREFSERGDDGTWRTDWAVHVALWERGRGLVAGAVGMPARGSILHTGDGHPVAPTEVWDGSRPLRLAVSRTRPPALVDAIAARHEVELVPMGSAGIKAMAVVSGEVDAYLHGGGQYEWDSAAPVAVARSAGLHTSRLDGSELEYNQPNPWLPDLAICPPALWPMLSEWIADAGPYVKSASGSDA